MSGLTLKVIPVFALLGLAGCCPNGCFVLTGEAYRALAYPKPMINSWEKENTPAERRKTDWELCGGSEKGNFSPQGEDLIAEKRPEERDSVKAHRRLYLNLERCMLRKGYRYVGICRDNEISRTSPACGAP